MIRDNQTLSTLQLDNESLDKLQSELTEYISTLKKINTGEVSLSPSAASKMKAQASAYQLWIGLSSREMLNAEGPEDVEESGDTLLYSTGFKE